MVASCWEMQVSWLWMSESCGDAPPDESTEAFISVIAYPVTPSPSARLSVVRLPVTATLSRPAKVSRPKSAAAVNCVLLADGGGAYDDWHGAFPTDAVPLLVV